MRRRPPFPRHDTYATDRVARGRTILGGRIDLAGEPLRTDSSESSNGCLARGELYCEEIAWPIQRTALSTWLGWPGVVIGAGLAVGSAEFLGPNEERGWGLA